MTKIYTVNHGFAHDGVFYARDNAADIAKLPQPVIDDVVGRGLVTVVEQDDRAQSPTPGIQPIHPEA